MFFEIKPPLRDSQSEESEYKCSICGKSISDFEEIDTWNFGYAHPSCIEEVKEFYKNVIDKKKDQ